MFYAEKSDQLIRVNQECFNLLGRMINETRIWDNYRHFFTARETSHIHLC